MEEGHEHGLYKPVPSNFDQMIPDSLKKLLEFPGFAKDNFSRMKEEYVAMGIEPSNLRHGFIRTKV